MGFLDFLNPLSLIAGSLERAHKDKLAASNHSERIKADVEISGLNVKRDLLIALISEPWFTPRSLMGYSVTFLVFKLVVWDSALGLGTTQDVGSLVTWITVTVIGFYFVSKSAETITSTIAGVIARKYK